MRSGFSWRNFKANPGQQRFPQNPTNRDPIQGGAVCTVIRLATIHVQVFSTPRLSTYPSGIAIRNDSMGTAKRKQKSASSTEKLTRHAHSDREQIATYKTKLKIDNEVGGLGLDFFSLAYLYTANCIPVFLNRKFGFQILGHCINV